MSFYCQNTHRHKTIQDYTLWLCNEHGLFITIVKCGKMLVINNYGTPFMGPLEEGGGGLSI